MGSSKIKLDKQLLKRCGEHARKAGYSTVEEFVEHTLEKELAKNSGDSATARTRNRYSLAGPSRKPRTSLMKLPASSMPKCGPSLKPQKIRPEHC